jgi:hypothetical protein
MHIHFGYFHNFRSHDIVFLHSHCASRITVNPDTIKSLSPVNYLSFLFFEVAILIEMSQTYNF